MMSLEEQNRAVFDFDGFLQQFAAVADDTQPVLIGPVRVEGDIWGAFISFTSQGSVSAAFAQLARADEAPAVRQDRMTVFSCLMICRFPLARQATMAEIEGGDDAPHLQRLRPLYLMAGDLVHEPPAGETGIL